MVEWSSISVENFYKDSKQIFLLYPRNDVSTFNWKVFNNKINKNWPENIFILNFLLNKGYVLLLMSETIIDRKTDDEKGEDVEIGGETCDLLVNFSTYVFQLGKL